MVRPQAGFPGRHAGQVQAVDGQQRVRRVAGPRRRPSGPSGKRIPSDRGWQTRSGRPPRRWRSIFPAAPARCVGPIACSRSPGCSARTCCFRKRSPIAAAVPTWNCCTAPRRATAAGSWSFPMNAVRWLTEPREIAALVTDRGRDRFSAELFHFGERPRTMAAELYLLTPGRYTLTLADSDGNPLAAPKPFQVDGPRTRIDFELPPGRPCVLQAQRQPAVATVAEISSRCSTLPAELAGCRFSRGVSFQLAKWATEAKQ